MYIIINAVLAGATVWIAYKYLEALLIKKKLGIFGIISWIVYYIVQLMVECYNGTEYIYILASGILSTFIIAIVDYYGKVRKKIFYIILLYVIWALMEMLVYFALKKLPIGIMDFSILGSVISKFVAIILINLLSMKKLDIKENVPKKVSVMLLLIPIGSIFISHNIFLLDNEQGHKVTSMIAFGLLLAINVIIFEVYMMLSKSYEIQKENAIIEQQIEILSDHAEERKRMMEEFQETKHNLVNQLIVLKSNVERKIYTDAIRLIDDLMSECITIYKNISDSGNDIVDAMINHKYSITRKYDIDFELKIYIPQQLPLQQRDLGVIIGNLLDNAIDATKEYEGKKVIYISAGVKKEAFVLVVKNPYKHKLLLDGQGNFMTTKEEKKNHGYGIYSVEKIADKYEGDVTVEIENGIFCVTVVLNLKGF